jgi:hypothetical protein
MESKILRMIGAAALVAMMLGSSCDEEESKGFAPADCVRQPPETGIVHLTVRIDGDHRSVPVQIFRGPFEDDIVVVSDTLTTETEEYELPPDADYSAAAQYEVGAGLVIAVDGGHLNLTYTDYEDARCWEAGRLNLNLYLDDIEGRKDVTVFQD